MPKRAKSNRTPAGGMSPARTSENSAAEGVEVIRRENGAPLVIKHGDVEIPWEEFNKLVEEQLKRQAQGIGRILEVQLGKLKDFIPVEKLRDKRRGERDAIQLVIETPDGYTIRKAMVISFNPQSQFYKLVEKLGHAPKPGDEIELERDRQGFWRVKAL